jgi:hypothetical protein
MTINMYRSLKSIAFIVSEKIDLNEKVNANANTRVMPIASPLLFVKWYSKQLLILDN